MITALQNFISKQSKVLFPVLLLVIIVSFVLYLSQGSSVFDLLPDPNREKRVLYGVDLNHPDERRIVTMSNRVSADFGAIISPSAEAFEKADRQFLENLQRQIQNALQSDQENMDRNVIQQLFGFMQQWPNLPKSIKLREIARSGMDDFEFMESSAQSKISLDGQADAWGFMPLSVNHPKINTRFNEFLGRLDRGLANDENRTRAMQFVGRSRGFSPVDIETILYSQFRAQLVDQTYSQGGFSLSKEAELDLHGEQFAWDAEALSLRVEDLNLSDPALGSISLNEDTKEGSSLKISYGNKSLSFEFSEDEKEKNGSRVFVNIKDSLKESLVALKSAIDLEDFGVESEIVGESIQLTPKRLNLPVPKPMLMTENAGISISETLEKDLLAYHSANRDSLTFSEPARTYATAIVFQSKDHLQLPPAPDEARMVAYFERNKDQFSIPVDEIDNNSSQDAKGAKGPVGPSDSNVSEANSSIPAELELDLLAELGKDENDSELREVSFEEVKDQVRQRIIDGDRIDAERYAENAAKEAAFKFLDEINELQDILRSKYSSYQQRRNSTELSALLTQPKIKLKSISFADRDMPMQGAILGLEMRESERRMNKQPLEEVKSLNERNFFTRSVRKARDGFVVFVFDRATESGPGDYSTASFSDLYKGYADQLKTEQLLAYADKMFSALNDQNASVSNLGIRVVVERKSTVSVRASFDSENNSLGRNLTSLQDERSQISDSERDGNATEEQLAKKLVLDDEIEKIREQQAMLNRQRSLAVRLVEACENLSPDEKWEELERSDSEVIFVRSKGVYTIRSKDQSVEQISERVFDLEMARSEESRGELVEDLIQKGFTQ